ncbi:hypothetical protein CAEBREN_06048 [Caenorhabditis brenneri]|uniref:Uncharacterized protein n=1 Tax=Caenorhabditis brenneri TaxID=135651 RepID=G0NDZ1_CAEBE|nr:hypothetical protein CAEBREN_06048 [Caenorhabditis brenneri]
MLDSTSKINHSSSTMISQPTQTVKRTILVTTSDMGTEELAIEQTNAEGFYLTDAYEEKIETLTEANRGLEEELTDAYATISHLMKEDDEFKKQKGILWDHAIATLKENEAKRAICSIAVSGLPKQLEEKETHLKLKAKKVKELEKDTVLLKGQLISASTQLTELDEKWKKENEELKTRIENLTRNLKEPETSRQRSANKVEPNEEELDQLKENEGVEGEPPSKKSKLIEAVQIPSTLQTN